MGHTIDTTFLELLTSKICHDLISPIGAVANGIEFMDDMGGAADDDILDLLRISSSMASAKLQAFRVAYGAGGGDVSVKPEEAHKAFGKFIGQDKKITQDWDPHAPLGPEERPEGFTKLLMCLLLLCAECLPKGGAVTVTKAGENKTAITAQGNDAMLKSPMDKALLCDMRIEAIEPRYVHAFMTGLMAKEYGFTISARNTDNQGVEFILESPAS